MKRLALFLLDAVLAVFDRLDAEADKLARMPIDEHDTVGDCDDEKAP